MLSDSLFLYKIQLRGGAQGQIMHSMLKMLTWFRKQERDDLMSGTLPRANNIHTQIYSMKLQQQAPCTDYKKGYWTGGKIIVNTPYKMYLKGTLHPLTESTKCLYIWKLLLALVQTRELIPEPLGSGGPHKESTQSPPKNGQWLNPGPSRCEATVLTTASLCLTRLIYSKVSDKAY